MRHGKEVLDGLHGSCMTRQGGVLCVVLVNIIQVVSSEKKQRKKKKKCIKPPLSSLSSLLLTDYTKGSSPIVVSLFSLLVARHVRLKVMVSKKEREKHTKALETL